jgi:hypothetical protein
MKVLGVDPGIHGGLAIVEISDGTAPQLVDAIDIPTVGTAAKERVDAIALASWITTHRPQHALIERANGRRAGGSARLLRDSSDCGRAYGVEEISSAAGDKESSRQRALRLFPNAHTLLARKKNHGRAEAALIALTGISA